MNVSRYDLVCQKSLHMGLQYAKSLGHKTLEVEHVALALLRSGEVDGFDDESVDKIAADLQRSLLMMPKIYGELRIAFGRRLDKSLDEAESQVGENKVSASVLWPALKKQSTAIRNSLLRLSNEDAQFEPLNFDKIVSGEEDKDDSNSQLSSDEAQKKPSNTESTNEELKRHSDLAKYTVDLSELAERDELDPVLGRDSEIRRVMEILGRKKKNNPILLGEPGVGKSAIAEGLAIKIASGNVPPSLRHKRVLSLNVTALIAGARFRGEFEDRMQSVLKSLAELKGKIILFIDEIHMIVGAGSTESSVDAANIMKPALARGEILALGATTLDEFKTSIEADPALERRFQPIIVEEPSSERALAILRGLRSKYEIHHGVRIADDALVASVQLSQRYLQNRRLPDKAIDLIDEAASRLKLQLESLPVEIDDLQSTLKQLEVERASLVESRADSKSLAKLDSMLSRTKSEFNELYSAWNEHRSALADLKKNEKKRVDAESLAERAATEGNFDLAANLRSNEIPGLKATSVELRKKLDVLQKQNRFLGREVRRDQIIEVISSWTKIPIAQISQNDASGLMGLPQRMRNQVFGQDHAIDAVCKRLKRASTGVADSNRTLGVFLFLGQTGVGKTELAKAVSREFFGAQHSLVRFDMGEFSEAHHAARLIGAPPGYVGFGGGGELTEAVKFNPHCVILLDEVDKAHPRVMDLFLQLFDEGQLTDAKGRLFDFKNTVIVMTANFALSEGFNPARYNEKSLRQEVTKHVRPEIVNRMDDIVLFNPLEIRAAILLTERLERELNQRLERREWRVRLGKKLKRKLADIGINAEFGGREIRRSFDDLVSDEVAERLIHVPYMCNGAWVLELSQDGHLRWQADFGLHQFLSAKTA